MAGTLFLKRQNTGVRAENEIKNENVKNIYSIDVKRIFPNPAQPRKYFTDDAILRLADSIRNHGLIQPLTVRVRENGDYELIAGERRLRALKLIGNTEAPCVISSADSEESAHLAIIENIQRENLNIFEQAEAILNLMKVHCLTQEKIAAELSCSQSYVANKLRLLRISDDEKELIVENSLTERHARALLRIKDDDKRITALKHVIRYNLNVAATEEYIDKLLTVEKERRVNDINTKIIIKDIRLFYNTIDKAIDTIRASGINVETLKKENREDTEIVIVIPKCST